MLFLFLPKNPLYCAFHQNQPGLSACPDIHVMSNNKLKIRIQIQQQPPQAIEEIYPEPEIIYEQVLDWRKIAAAAAAMLAVLVLLGYLLSGSSNDDSASSDPAVAGSDPVLSDRVPPVPAADNQSTEAESGSDITIESLQSIPAGPAAVTAAPAKVIKPRKKPQFQRVAPQPAANAVPKTANQVKPHKPNDHPVVLRAQLSHAITSREPVDSIDTVQLRGDETRPIHFYVHLKNLQGKKIQIEWYYNDKLDSQLRLQVHNNNWRTHASKQLDQRRLGAWRVELTDDQSNQLATRSFTVTQI